MIYSKAPNYNLAVVLKETGIKPDTLRAWERRYGLPMPGRTSGGHRLYSQFDIETIKWLLARLDEGLRINRAVKLWGSMEASGKDPFVEMPVGAPTGEIEVTEFISGISIDELRQKWVQACLDLNETLTEQILAQAFAIYPVKLVCLEIMRAGLSRIGELWYRGESSVQQEHFASALVLRRLHALIAASPSPTKNETILVGCPPIEEHEFSSLLITLFLRRQGWNVIYLGTNIPSDRFDEIIENARPSLVVMTAMQLYTAANLTQFGDLLFEKGVPLGYGGLIFSILPGLKERIAGYYLGDSLERVVPEVEKLLSGPKQALQQIPVLEDHNQAYEEFSNNLPQIDAYMWEIIHRNGMTESHLEIANLYLGRDIKAALRLGDIGFAGEEIPWIEALLENHGIPQEYLQTYLQNYQLALEKHLDKRGQLILDWMKKITSPAG